jgi:hypothetical protein
MRALSIFLVACLLSAPLSARPVEQTRRDAASPQFTSYEFLEAIIGSLARSYVALKLVNDKADDSSLVERMTAIQNASIELGIAERNIQPFLLAPNENVRVSTAGTIDAYTAMQKSLAISLAIYEKVDAAKSEDDLVGLRRQISDAKVLYQQASLILIDATGIAFASTLVPDPKDPANHVALSMTAAQKGRLLKALESGFGPDLRKKKSDNDTGPLQAARALRDLLEKKWRFAT